MPSSNTVGGGILVNGGNSGSLTVAAGASGNILTITNDSHDFVRLNSLGAISSIESGITITVDGKVIVNSLNLAGSVTSGGFFVSQGGGLPENTSLGLLSNVIQDIVGKEIIITKDSGSTAVDISYSFTYLDYL